MCIRDREKSYPWSDDGEIHLKDIDKWQGRFQYKTNIPCFSEIPITSLNIKNSLYTCFNNFENTTYTIFWKLLLFHCIVFYFKYSLILSPDVHFTEPYCSTSSRVIVWYIILCTQNTVHLIIIKYTWIPYVLHIPWLLFLFIAYFYYKTKLKWIFILIYLSVHMVFLYWHLVNIIKC